MRRKETYLGGLRKLLYGKYRPEILLRREGEERGMVCQILLSEPATPVDYMNLDRSLRERWGELTDSELMKEWPADYFFLPDDCPKPIHILCSFYRKFIRYELRMTFLAMLKKQEDSSVPTEVLRYELVIALESWLDLLKDCEERLRTGELLVMREEAEHAGVVSSESLQRYLWQRLFLNLKISVFELQLRFPLIPEHRRINRHHLYLKKLGVPVPGQAPYVRTLEQTERQLELLIGKKDGLTQIDNLIRNLQFEIFHQPVEELRNILSDSLNLLQNARICITMKSAEEGEEQKITFGMIDAEQSRSYLSALIEKLQKGVELSTAEKKAVDHLMHAVADFRELFMTSRSGKESETESEAVRLLRLIDTCFGSPKMPDPGFKNELKEAETPYGTGLLGEYLDMDEIIRKLNVTSKTMKKYLDESGVEVIEFSSQRQLIHMEEVRKLLNYYAKLKR